MKTLRHFVKSGSTEDKGERRSRKISLPAQRYQPELCEGAKETKRGSIWQNVKRKISFSVSTEDPLKTEEQETSTKKCDYPSKCDFKKDEAEVSESPRLRRVNSDVVEEDVMHFAIIEGDAKLLKSVIEGSKVNINYLRPPGNAALHQACISGNLEIVELLVKNGANINLRDHRDLSPLQIANIYGYFEIAEFLIRVGSPVAEIKDGFRVDRRRRKRSWFHRFGPRLNENESVKDSKGK